MTEMKNGRVVPAEMGYQPSNPLFIMGFSRTGSTLLQQILNKYSEIGIIPEMHFLWPRLLHRDFATMMKRHVGKKINERNIDQLIEMIFSKRLQGVFWKDIDKYKMD
jgi:hypothetical protein